MQSDSGMLQRLPHMHNNVGNAYRKVGKLNEAKTHLEKAKEMMVFIHQDEVVDEMAKVNSLTDYMF